MSDRHTRIGMTNPQANYHLGSGEMLEYFAANRVKTIVRNGLGRRMRCDDVVHLFSFACEAIGPVGARIPVPYLSQRFWTTARHGENHD